jgi:hypothetical protein
MESNVKKKDKGEGLAGGETSADYMISESEGESQLSETTKSSRPAEANTTGESNVKTKDKGEGLAGGETSADYMISESEGENKGT